MLIFHDFETRIKKKILVEKEQDMIKWSQRADYESILAIQNHKPAFNPNRSCPDMLSDFDKISMKSVNIHNPLALKDDKQVLMDIHKHIKKC